MGSVSSMCRAASCLMLALVLVLGVGASPIHAQSNSLPDILDRGIDGFMGGDDENPRTYASPSANELIPDAAEVGVPQMRSLRPFDPIELPKRDGAHTGAALDLPSLPAYAPQLEIDPDTLRPQSSLVLEAKLSDGGPNVPDGLVWRLFSAVPSLDGRSSLVAMSMQANPRFDVPRGSYVVHVSFGRAGVVKRIDFSGLNTTETIVLGAGGLKLDAAISEGGLKAIRSNLKFDIYTEPERESDRELIASDVPAGEVVRLNAGLYRIVSTYGAVNARTQADVQVDAGKLVEATLQHRAAEQTLKLVREHGGEAIADTAWTVMSMSGDVLRKSAGAYATMVLAEGDYMAVARNRDLTYQRNFTVKAGEDGDVEVMMSDLTETGSGD